MNRTVVVLVDDLFWRTKIEHTAKSASRSVVFVSDPDELATKVNVETVALVVVDLSLRKDPFGAIAKLKKSPKTKAIPIIGYYEHVRKDMQKKGVEAGCDEVLPRSTFSERFGDLVLKYALPGGVRTETEEPELPEE